MDTTDKYLAITKYLSDVSVGSICFFDKFLVIVKKKMDPMDTTDKYLAITKYLSDVSIGSIFFYITNYGSDGWWVLTAIAKSSE
jgi:hypothetical protein